MRIILKACCFFFALFLLILKEYWTLFFFDSSTPAPLLGAMVYISAGLLGIAIFLNKLTKIEFLVLVLALIAFILKRNISFPLIALTTISSKDIDLKKIIQFHFAVSITLFFIVLALGMVDLMPSTKVVDTRITDGYRIIRHNLGFGSANGAFLFFFPILTSAIFLLENRYYKVITFPILFLFIHIIYMNTLSRTGFYSSIFLFILLIISAFGKFRTNKFQGFILKNIIVLFLTLSIIVAMFFNTPKWNSILALRPNYWLVHLLQGVYKFNLWGYPWNEKYRLQISEIPLDNSFLSMILSKGAIFSIIIYLFYFFGIKKILGQGAYKSLIILFAILTFSFFENTLFIVAFNISFFILYHSIHNNNNNNKIESKDGNSQNNSLLLAQ